MIKIILISILLLVTILINNQIKSDDLLKLRNLQYEQAKRVIRMQDLRNEFDKLNSEQQDIKVKIDDWIKEQAKANNIDLEKSYFDLDQLKFVEREKK